MRKGFSRLSRNVCFAKLPFGIFKASFPVKWERGFENTKR